MLREVTEEEFRQSVNQGLVLADFFSSTCGPCKMLSFVLADVDKTSPAVRTGGSSVISDFSPVFLR